MAKTLPRDVAALTLARQVIRSGTSVGANVEEAQGAHSRADFARRMNIARTEARETLYWLRLLVDTGYSPENRMQPLLQEAEELVKILVSIAKKARSDRAP